MRGACGLAGVMVLTGTAYAGRTYYGWLLGTDVQPQRGVELMSSIYEEREEGDGEARWWGGPLVGVTDRLELGLPLELASVGSTPTRLDRYGLDLRYRLASADPVDAPAVVPLLRAGVDRIIGPDNAFAAHADLVMSYTLGRLQVLAEAGGCVERIGDVHRRQLRPGAGISIRAVDDLRLGAEVYAELALHGTDGAVARSTTMQTDGDGSWVIVGPNLAWSYGRFWVSAAYGVGITGIDSAARTQWGVAF